MSTTAAFSCDVSTRDIAVDESVERSWWSPPWDTVDTRQLRPHPWGARRPPPWYADNTAGNQATGVTLIEEPSDWLVKAYKRLAGFASLKNDWDSYDADPPAAAAIEVARQLLERLASHHLQPSDIDPSAEGGVCVSFRQGNRYGDLECFNSGEVLAVTSSGGDETEVWEVDGREYDLRNTLERLRAFLGR